MSLPLNPRRISLYFHISVFLKGLASLIEVIAGVLMLFIPVSSITNLVVALSQAELIEDPDSFVATHAVTLAHQFSYTSSLFIAFYLLSRGAIKLALVVALLKNQLWAYPTSLAFLGLLVLFQLYEILRHFSSGLIALTVFDFIVMWFIYREYQLLRAGALPQGATSV